MNDFVPSSGEDAQDDVALMLRVKAGDLEAFEGTGRAASA